MEDIDSDRRRKLREAGIRSTFEHFPLCQYCALYQHRRLYLHFIDNIVLSSLGTDCYLFLLRDSNSRGRLEAEVVGLAIINVPHLSVSVALPFPLSLCPVCSSGLRRGMSRR
jgi:hypothetical protein